MDHDKILTIGIPTWNRCALLKDLLDQLISQIVKFGLESKIEVLVSNNGSEDDTESLVKSCRRIHKFITYNNNGTNIGAKENVLKAMELASGKFWMMLGDDDRIHSDCLPALIEFLENEKDVGVVLDSENFKKTPFGKIADITLHDLIENYYWHLGNAGLFISRTSLLKDNLKLHPYEYYSISWPQIQLQILGLYQNKNLRIHIRDFNILSEAVHGEVTVYSSYYLWRTCQYDLNDAIESIGSELDAETVGSAKKYLKDNIRQTFFNILQCGVFIDDKEIRLRTAEHIAANIDKFSDAEKKYLRIIRTALSLPSPLSRMISNAFIFFTRGKTGMNKKNEYVKSELSKKEKLSRQKSLAVREFKF
jgi:glycosyltransferase involved in cell wall biosynthesis